MGTRKRPASDPVNPAHYRKGKIELIDAQEAAISHLNGMEGYLVGQCLKYLFRFRLKGTPLEDCQKAMWYLKRLESLCKDAKDGTKAKIRRR